MKKKTFLNNTVFFFFFYRLWSQCTNEGRQKSLFLHLFCQISHCFLPVPWLICCSHSFNIWKLGRAAGSRFQHCFMMLYTTSGQPSGQSILYPFSTRGTTSFSGYRMKRSKVVSIKSVDSKCNIFWIINVIAVFRITQRRQTLKLVNTAFTLKNNQYLA